MRLKRVEVMGRDTSVVSTHPSSRNAQVRSIISARNQVDKNADTVRFSLIPDKVAVFSAQGENTALRVGQLNQADRRAHEKE